MTSNIYAKRYSKSIFKMALENKDVNQWQTDLRKVSSLMGDKALFTLIANPAVTIEEKRKALSQRLNDVNPLAIKLVILLAAKNRLNLIDDIADGYQALVDNYRGIEGAEIAEVTTAIPIDDDYKLKIAQRITEIIGKPVVLKPKVDPDIIGGIVIRVGDKLIDGSIRSKLVALKKELGGVGQ
ncbi:MAG: F0F1 ATP synthase subunit delta [Chloroflexi bacterium]|jgi:F-type H+-transporting ATPase subunit delta|nr:F0F1 ATP synthase subunit delta [Chloroflexota bacterium]